MLLQVLESRQNAPTQSAGSNRAAAGDGDPPAAVPSALEQVDIAALLRHELAPAVGWVRLAADDEIESFATSRTNDAVRKLQRRIDGLVAMIKSSEALTLTRLRLPHVLIEAWPEANAAPLISPPPSDAQIEIETDEGLFSLMLSNIFQNAIDASLEATGKVLVQITWGYTDKNYWVRVSNPFSGDSLRLADVVQVGTSTKVAHQGRGLALIQMVAQRLSIAITLDGASGTASFALSGSRPNA